ncbi:MAG: DUF1499 domain-containing protein [Vicinamibacterales bacterium]
MRRFHWIATLALVAALAGALMLASSGLGYRLGWWSLQRGFQLLTWGAFAGVGAAVLGLAGLALNRPRQNARGFVLAGVGLLAGVLLAGIPWQWQRTAAQVPRIHDISTDTETPPDFVRIAEIRTAANAPNALDYSAEVAAEQRQGYPDLGPLALPVPPDEAYQKALATAEARGWEIVTADAAARRIEATDTTFWFGFKDDIAVRVTPAEGGGSRIDVRSVSRVGRSDVGTNARRIREYLADIARR